MKEEILKRAMFAMPLSKDSRNSGIMAGFDMEDMDEVSGMESMEEPDEGMSQMERTPQNPEILMNNLRGDVRSVDARYQELAQMVGEQAAQETPPEVLALLQEHMAMMQQGGIGGLPEAQGMPGMPPPPGAAPEGMPGMPPQPQPGAMPAGMEGAGPLPQGGASEAPPTPDGMPPMTAALGAFVTPMQRLAQFSADKLGTLGTQANAVGGRLMSQGFPQTFRPIFENVRGAGGRFTAEQTLKYPTLTEHLGNVLPRTTAIAGKIPTPGAPALLGGTAGAYLGRLFSGEKSEDEKADDARREALVNLIPTEGNPPAPAATWSPGSSPMPGKMTATPGPGAAPAVPPPAAPSSGPLDAASAFPVSTTSDDPLGDFIAEKLKAQQGREAAAPKAPQFVKEVAKSKIERIKEAQGEYGPMFKELLGDTSEDMRMNAYLMLADAGLRLASSPNRPGSTPVSQVAEAFAPMAKGFMGLVAQARDRQLKVDMGALERAITDIDLQDKMAAQYNLEILRGDTRARVELIKQMSKGNLIQTLGPAGLINYKDAQGNEYEPVINANSPEFVSIVNSPNTLRQTDNPFVTDAGPVAQALIVKDPKRRGELVETVGHFDDSINKIDILQKNINKAFGGRAFGVDKYNNYILPFVPGGNIQWTDRQRSVEEFKQAQESLGKSLAMADRSGRLTVQQEKWAREALDIAPAAFFTDPQLAAARLNQARAGLLNSRQGVVEQLGGTTSRLIARPMPLGTDNDPFVIPADSQGQQAMFNFLRGSFARTMDPNGKITVRAPDQLDDNGRVLSRGGLRYMTAAELMSLK